LGEELDLPPVSEVREAIEDGLAGYRSALSSSAFREALAPYVQGLPRRGDLATKLESILRLGGEVNPRQITALFSEDVIGHLNRCMSGKTLRPRNMADLRDALAGRTVTKEEAQRLFAQWLDGAGEDEGESLLHIEP